MLEADDYDIRAEVIALILRVTETEDLSRIAGLISENP